MSSFRRLGFWFALLIICLVSSGAAQEKSDDADLRALVKQFFTAYANKDLAEWRRLWSAGAPELAARAQQLERLFPTLGAIELKSVTLKQISLDGAQANVRAAVELNATDLKTGKPAAGFGQWQRALQCVKEAGQWRVRRETSVARAVAGALAALPDEAARQSLLAAESESVNPELVRELLLQGDQLTNRENFAAALSLLQFARALAERLGDQLDLARAWSFIGHVYHAQGDYVMALSAQQQSLKLARELNQPIGIFANLNNIGSIYGDLGDYAAALAVYQEGLKLSEAQSDPNNVAIMRNNLANVYSSLGNYTAALEQLQRSFELSEKSGSNTRRGIALHTLAVVYLMQGSNDLAEARLQESLALLREADEKPERYMALAGTLLTLGHLQKRKGLFDQAREYYQETLRVARAHNDQANLARATHALGEVLLRQKNYAAAQAAFEQSLALREKQGNYEGQGAVLQSLGMLAIEQQQYEKALGLAERAVALARRSGARELLWQTRTLAGQAHAALAQPGRAREAYEEAVAVIEDLWLRAAGGEQQQQYFFERKLTPYHGLIELLLRERQPEAALGYAERAKARVLLEVLQSGRVNITKAMTQAEQEREHRLKEEMVSLNTQLSFENLRAHPDQARLSDLNQRQRQARLAYEEFQTALYASHPDLKAQRGQTPAFTLADAAALLPDEHGALLEYVLSDEQAWLFVLTRAAAKAPPELKVYELPRTEQPLTEQARAFRAQIAQHDLLFGAAAERLYDALLRPAQAQLRGKTRLVIVPDGALWELPFEALKSSPQRYLLEDYEISRAPSLAALAAMSRATRAREGNKTLLALGNPAFAPIGEQSSLRAARMSLAPLPETESEVRALARLYGPAASKVLTGAVASEQQFKAEAGKYRVLHLATHGVFDDASPMYSQLVLAQPGERGSGQPEDGLLEAWEIAQLDLQAELVVLSACETARGRIGAGEGVLGLVWALFVAGSPATVVSQWKVNSASAADLMLEFHRDWLGGTSTRNTLSKAGALRAAALKLLHSKQYHHPFYWAGFALIGDGR
jgi:CHAT domain-containing protein/uncharacterized protein HemY